jgi:hypothetical protein
MAPSSYAEHSESVSVHSSNILLIKCNNFSDLIVYKIKVQFDCLLGHCAA